MWTPSLVWSAMYFFYVDEAGSPEGHHEPLLNGETPIFTLNSVCVRADRWREIDRAYLGLKRRFFEHEIGIRRPENYEVKGNDLSGPHQRNSSRRREFVRSVLALCKQNNACLFSIVFIKNPLKPTSKNSLYTMALQYLAERFQLFLEETSAGETGIIIADSRITNLNDQVAISHLSFVFGHEAGRRCDRLLEAPLFANSRLTAGLQLADIVSSCLYTYFYSRNCIFIPGSLDYTHMAYAWNTLNDLEFKSNNLREAHPKKGYRVIDFHD